MSKPVTMSSASVQSIVDAESDKLTSIDRSTLTPDADAICKSLSAVAGLLAAVALAIEKSGR